MPTALRIIVYPLFAVFCLVVFFIILFPFESVKDRFAREMEQKMGGSYSISIGSLSPALFTGVVLKDVEIKPRGAPDASPVKLSKAKLKFSLLSILGGNLEVHYDLRANQGRAEGFFSWKKSGMVLDLKMNSFDLAMAGFLAQQMGVPLTGLVNGNVNLELYSQDPLRNTGNISLEMPDLHLGELSLGGGALQFPPLNLVQSGGSPSKVNLLIDKGNIEVQGVQLSGDLDFQASGKIYGARKTENYRFNLQGTFKVSPAVADKIPLLMAIEKQKGADGSYPFTITGRISKPSIRIGEFKVPI